MNRRPSVPPIGIVLSSVAREVERAFDAALEEVGGSRPTWLVLMALKQGPLRNQRQLAAMVGIESATLSHHLNGMEAAGLLTRRRDPANRRMHLVELTHAGEAAFFRMLGTVRAFDHQLRAGIDDSDIALVEKILGQVRANVTAHRGDEPLSPESSASDATLVPTSN